MAPGGSIRHCLRRSSPRGGRLLALGLFGLFVVVVEVPAVKMLLIGAMLYAVVRAGWAIGRAVPNDVARDAWGPD